ncbi:restriction endonuclease PLD domain-containing protein [Peribacillus frigoritolerans]|uniref:restriction endonuclease PLD domain-containing protein n=1 Tax=Peribacillus frigoritolerans TaxID=450367 RepID=UPI00399F6772
MHIRPNIFNGVLVEPYKLGKRTLKVLTGYASSAFVYHVLETLPEVKLELIIGMANKDGINRWDHEEFKRICNDTNRMAVYYYTGNPPIHSKVVTWNQEDSTTDKLIFTGSANFSWNGFRDYQEIMVETDPQYTNSIFNITEIIECTDPNVEQHIQLNDISMNRQRQIFIPQQTEAIGNVPIDPSNLEFVDVSLKMYNGNDVHEKSGLNWGQRPGREPNQAYIPVKREIHKNNPDFFPDTKEEFTIITDDGKSLICVMAQDNRKAIETCRNNSILGIYFRGRLGVPAGQKVESAALSTYGRDSVRIYKINKETYFMDFSNNADCK